MPNLSVRRPGALRLAIAGLALGLAAAPVEAATGRHAPTSVGAAKQAGLTKHKGRHARALPGKPAPASAKPPIVPAAATEPAEPPAAWTAAEPEGRACFRGRRKLWQDGEGWVVKRVNLCP